jgi:aspartate aminotransferase
MKFASRLEGIDESATFRYSTLAKEKKVINLTIGRTNFDTPSVIKEETKRAIDDGKIHYTPTKGIPRLRELIAKKLEGDNNIPGLGSENILVSAGAKHIIFEAVMSIIQRGDIVAIPDPSWVSYGPIVRLAEGGVRWLPLKAENDFVPDDDFFSALEETKPKLILINSPNNPTGAVYPEKTIRKIVDVAERKDAFILSDEIYEKILYEGKHFSAGSIYENTITVNGFSKEFSMTGWRLGYAASRNREVIDRMDLIQSQTVSCATSFVQNGAVAAFTEDARRGVEKMMERLRDRRDYAMGRMKNMRAVLKKPPGAFYLFPFFGEIDDVKLADRLIENGVGVIPGSPFGSSGKGCVRMSYGAVDIESLERAMDILEKIV